MIAEINRPKALNALNLDIVDCMNKNLTEWNMDESGVSCFVLKGAGDKAFCAGGDVKAIWQAESPLNFASSFFSNEYRMNYALHISTVSQISFWNGVVMGGGVGISVFGKFRVCTEKTIFAMPETAIGLFPDVGSSYWLSKLNGGYGEYIGLTGCRLSPADLLGLRIATHYVPTNRLEALEEEISQKVSLDRNSVVETLNTILSKYEEPLQMSEESLSISRKVSEIFETSENILDIFSKLKDLDKKSDPWASNTLASLLKASPTSLELTLRQIRQARINNLSLRECLKMVSFPSFPPICSFI